MENHQQHFILQKVYRLFPSSLTSCHFRSIPDVAESSITIPKKTNRIHHENDVTSSFKKTQPKLPNKNPKSPKHRNRYKCPPVTTHSKPNGQDKKFQENKRNVKSCSVPNSSSANSGWFSSSDEKNDTFVSFTSNSGDSFRLKTSQRFRKYEEMKKINETERCSFSSITSFDTLSKSTLKKSHLSSKNINNENRGIKSGKIFPEYELGLDQISAELYYSSNRRRKTEKKRRKVVKKINCKKSSVIEESYAVEKNSRDLYGDFRASMVEMIVEKQMFGAEDLERLLQCFLSLNAAPYHGIILDVFSEICETLFSN